MGGGIALAVKNKFHAAYQADLATEYASRHKMGLFSLARVTTDPNIKFIVNLYAQYSFGTDRVQLDYGAFESGMRRVVTWAEGENPKMVIGIPYGIGCGLAGGKFSVVQSILRKSFENSTVTGLVCRKPV